MNWISVDEKLPEEFSQLLIAYNKKVYLATYYDEQWRYLDDIGGYVFSIDEEDMQYVTHWIPLPTPPEKE